MYLTKTSISVSVPVCSVEWLRTCVRHLYSWSTTHIQLKHSPGYLNVVQYFSKEGAVTHYDAVRKSTRHVHVIQTRHRATWKYLLNTKLEHGLVRLDDSFLMWFLPSVSAQEQVLKYNTYEIMCQQRIERKEQLYTSLLVYLFLVWLMQVRRSDTDPNASPSKPSAVPGTDSELRRRLNKNDAVPDNYIVVSNDDLIRLRYILVFSQRRANDSQ